MNILITGGTGSLGQALTEKLLNSRTYERICIYSRGEHRQEQMKERFHKHESYNKLRFFIGDVRDKDRLGLALRNCHLVVHAAALKIVPTAEYNPFEALKTNVIGAQNLIDCAINHWGANQGFLRIIAVSTDKAVNPINLYGATKLCAEKLFIDANNIIGLHGPRFSVARYGNVSNSNGSVIPLFQRQIANKEQPTITHPDMTRFWITLEEAVTLVFKSFNRMIGGEIFVPEMPSFNIVDLSNVFMDKYYLPEKRWHNIIGIRPGEKLHEVIITKEEREKTLHDKSQKLYIINSHELEPSAIMPGYEPLSSNSNEIKQLTREELKDKLCELGVISNGAVSNAA